MAKKERKTELLKPDEIHGETASSGFFAQLLDQFTIAWLFLTRVPLPGWWNKPEIVEAAPLAEGEDVAPAPKDKGLGMTPLADTVRAWPVVGIFVGALAGGALWLSAWLGLHPLAASFVGLGVAMVMTGALHEDGLADVADGFGGGDTKAKKLRIMRDSRIGAYGMLALIMGVGFKASSLGGFNAPAFAAASLLAAHVLSRAALPMMMVVMAPARKSGLGHGAGAPKREDAAMAAAIGILVAMLALGPGPGLVAAALAGLGVAGVGWLAQCHIGGYSGDVLGAAQQVAEALVLAGMAVALRTVFY